MQLRTFLTNKNRSIEDWFRLTISCSIKALFQLTEAAALKRCFSWLKLLKNC